MGTTTMTSPSDPIESTTASTASEARPAAAEVLNAEAVRGRGPSSRAISLAFLLLAVFACIYVARTLLFPIIMAVLLALLLRPAVLRLQRLKVPEAISAALVLGIVTATLALLVTHLYEPATRWVSMGPSEIRRLEYKLRDLARPVRAVRGATDKVVELADATAPAGGHKAAVVVERASFIDVFGTAQRAVGTALATLILLFFLLASGDLFLRKLMRVIPGLRDRILAVEISRSIQLEIGSYFARVTLINVGLGIATALTMMALDMPSPALIGTAAAVLNFVPYLGAAVTLVGILIIAAVSFDGAVQILLPVFAFLALTTIEGQLIQPIMHGRRFALNPVAVFIWLLLWGWLWSVPGLLVAVPILVALRICAEKLPSLSPLAELLGRD